MRSIPAAMTWEILARNRWGILSTTLGAIAFPAMILAALQSVGALDAEHSSILALQIILMQVNVLLFANDIFSAHTRTRQLFAYPIRNASIVVWRMLPSMLIAFLQTALCIIVLNWLFPIRWPIWGPACFVAVAIAAVQAVFWLTDRSLLWSILAFTVVAAVLGMWFKARYGPAIGVPIHPWNRITPAEVATMLTFAGVAFVVAVAGVTRNRQGEPPLSLGVVDWLYRVFDAAPARSKSWSTASRAYLAVEFRRKGWAMPALALGLLLTAAIVWLIVSRKPAELMDGILGCSGIQVVLSLICGLMLGRLGSNENDFITGQFLATRPMTDTQMARITLLNAAVSVLLTWVVWLVAFFVVSMTLLVLGEAQLIHLPPPLGWSILPGSLLAMWTVAAVLATIVMTGSDTIMKIVVALIFTAISLPLFAKFTLTQESQLLFFRIVAAIIAGAVLFGATWLFVAAHRRGLIFSPTIWISAGLWFTGVALTVTLWPAQLEPQWFGYLLAAAFFALAVAPLAAAPLAVFINRHR